MSEQTSRPNQPQPTSRLVGVLAEFDGPDQLVEACNQARLAGIRKMDAYSPFPVHGIDSAIGIGRTKLPFFVLAVGLSAIVIGLGLQYAVNATDAIGPFPGYPFRISGKPQFSLPANIPVTFEIIVLASSFAAFLGMLVMNGLPKFANPLHRIPRFKTATNNGFFLLVEADDPNYNPREIKNQLESWGAENLEEVEEDLTDRRLPAFVSSVLILLAVFCVLPPALIYRAQGETNQLPRLHVNPDMDWQHKSKAQQAAPNIAVDLNTKDFIFENQRVMRGLVPGTVVRGGLRDDSEYFEGIKAISASQEVANVPSEQVEAGSRYLVNTAKALTQDAAAPAEPAWVTEFPAKFEISQKAIERGQSRFNIYCAVCHGVTGEGNGMVNKRGNALNIEGKAQWINAKSFHDPTVSSQPAGRIYDTITNGRGGMGPYRAQIPVEDRWNIVLYMKALQLSFKDAVVKNDKGEWVSVSAVAAAPPAEETTEEKAVEAAKSTDPATDATSPESIPGVEVPKTE